MIIEGVRTQKQKRNIENFYKYSKIFNKPKKIIVRGMKREEQSGSYHRCYDEIQLDTRYDFFILLHENLHKMVWDLRKKFHLFNIKSLKIKYLQKLLDEILVTYVSVLFGVKHWIFFNLLIFCSLLLSSVLSKNIFFKIFILAFGTYSFLLFLTIIYVFICYIPEWKLNYDILNVIERIERKDEKQTKKH